MLNHHVSCFMMSCSETHFRFDNNIEFSLCFWVKRSTYMTFSVHIYSFKVFLPFFVPVYLCNFFNGISDLEFRRRKNKDIFQNILSPELFLNKSRKTVFSFDKAFKRFFAQFGN